MKNLGRQVPQENAGSRGPPKGRGGRPVGALSKATIAQLDVEAKRAKEVIERARTSGRKLGIEILEDLVHLFAGMAAVYQPSAPGQVRRLNENEGKFLTYAKLAAETARDLAKYQSPTFRAVSVNNAPAATERKKVINFTLQVFDNKGRDDPSQIDGST